MKVRDLLAALARQWDELCAQLSTAQVGRLDSLVTALVRETIPARLVRRAEDVVGHLVDVLPDGHPLLLILEEHSPRLANVTTDHTELAAWQPVMTALRARLSGSDEPTVEEVAAGASAWLLAVESVDEGDVRGLGFDPDDPGLIRLVRDGGGSRWPAFQFRHFDLVRSINDILRAADDPWGAADWWLGENSWLAGVPAELLGTVDAQVLIQAALDERGNDD